MRRRSLLLIAVLCLGCTDAAEVVDETPPPAVSVDFSHLSELLTGIQKTGAILVYEGLPSQFWEPQSRNKELGQKETLDVHGYPVYDQPQPTAGTDADQLTALFSAGESYQPYSPSKKCGGFTAEYCVEWTTGETTTHVLICLECDEAMLFGPKAELHCSLSPTAAQRLKQLLSPYQKNSPTEKPSQ